MIPATVLLGSMAAGGLGLYLSGSTGAPSTGIAKTVEDSVSSIADQVTKTAENVTEYVSPKSDDPQPVTPPVQPVVEEKPVEQPVKPVVEEKPVEPVEPVESVESVTPAVEPVESVTPAVEPVAVEERVESAEQPDEPTELKGGQRGGFGRPTWAPINPQSSLTQALGIVPGSTAGNVLATVTGSKTPQQIQQELVTTEQQIRAITTQQFQTNETYTEELNKFNGVSGTTGIRQDYLELVGQVSYWKFIEKLNSDKLRSFNGVPDPAPAATTNLQKQFDEDFKKTVEVGAPPKKTFEQWLKDSINDIKGRKKEKTKNFRGEKPPANESEYAKWYADLKTKTASSTSPATTTRMTEAEYKKVLNDEINAAKQKEDFIFKESMKKTEYDESVAKLTELRSKRSEIVIKLKELNETKRLLLEELSAYKVPQSSWDKTKQPEARTTVPTGEELNKLLIEYKAKQEEIKQKQVQIDEELSLKLQPDGTLSDATTYNSLKGELTTLKEDLKNIIAKIEGRSADQTKQLRALSELDTFIKQLKEQKVKAVTVFDNPDFRKVFDMLTVMSLDPDAKSFVVNLDKYSNFFVTTKGFSAYNGEVLDKVFYFLKNFTELISNPESQKLISNFGSKFGSTVGTVDDNIKKAKTFLENSGNTTTDEFKKLDATQRRILEGRSTAWHTFFTDSDSLKAIPKAFSSVLFKTELDKLVKLEGVFKRRILDKIDKTKFESKLTGPPPDLTTTTGPTGPTGPPEIPNLEGVPTDVSVTLTFVINPDTEYTIKQDDVDVGKITTVPHEINALSPLTKYRFQVTATNSFGSVDSNELEITTLAAIPLTPIVITAGAVTDTTITVSWTGAEGAIFTLRSGKVVTSPHTFDGLSPNKDYTIKIIGTRGSEIVDSSIIIKTALAPVAMKDGGTDTAKKVLCLENIGDQFLWNGKTYTVQSFSKETVAGCYSECIVADDISKQYTVKFDDSGVISEFKEILPGPVPGPTGGLPPISPIISVGPINYTPSGNAKQSIKIDNFSDIDQTYTTYSWGGGDSGERVEEITTIGLKPKKTYEITLTLTYDAGPVVSNTLKIKVPENPAAIRASIQEQVDKIKILSEKVNYKVQSDLFIQRVQEVISNPTVSDDDKQFLREKIEELKTQYAILFKEPYDPVVPPKPTVPPAPAPIKGPLLLNFPEGRPKPKPRGLFGVFGAVSDPDEWLRTLQEDVNAFNQAYNNTNFVKRVPGKASEGIGPGKLPLTQDTVETLKKINSIIRALIEKGLPSTKLITDDNISMERRSAIKPNLDTTIGQVNLTLGILFDDLKNNRKGGNHTTRRQRVRGMPKRAKTRRTY